LPIWDLPRQEDGVATARGLRVRADRGGRIGGADGLPGHAGILDAWPSIMTAARVLGHAAPRGPALLALHAVDHAQPAHLADHVGEVGAVADLDRELDHRDVGVALQVFHGIDVGLGLGHRSRDLRQHARPVLHLEAQRDVVVAGDLAVPADVDPALGRLAVFGHVRAFDPVHHHAAAGGVVTHDLVARDRHAAVGEGHHAAL